MEFFGSIPFLALKFLGFICLGAEKTAKGRRPSPCHPCGLLSLPDKIKEKQKKY
jgi:hypothetical protein